jgi:DNA-binding HxlR family transcriptional regulator
MLGYGQFCTVARGAEVIGERWTPLVVRELLCGSKRFNDIRRGVPRMSATLLAQRLRKLEEIGVIERVKTKAGAEYRLTAAGEELRPLVWRSGIGAHGGSAVDSSANNSMPDSSCGISVGLHIANCSLRSNASSFNFDSRTRAGANASGGWWSKTARSTCAGTTRGTKSP